MNNSKIEALAQHLEIDKSVIVPTSYDDSIFNVDCSEGEYMVCDESEADQKWEESLDSYLEECIYPDLDEALKSYFDDEAWKRDAKYDGRGHSLSSYDGNENEIQIDGEWFYIYRMN